VSAKKIILISSLVLVPSAAAAGLAYYKYAKNNFSVVPSLAPVHINGLENGVINMSLAFDVSSKARISFTIDSAELSVYFNSSFLGTVILPNPVQVPGNGTVQMNLVGNFDKSKLGDGIESYLIGAIFGGNTDRKLSVKGNCRVKIDNWLLKSFLVNVAIDETMSF